MFSADTGTNKKIRVQICLHATKLRNVAGMGRGLSDPFAVVTLLAPEGGNDKPVVLGRTETIKKSLNPLWTKTFTINFEFGKPQHINIGIYDESSKKTDRPMGSAMFEIGSVLGSKGNVKAKKLRRGGALYVRVERYRAGGSGDNENQQTKTTDLILQLRGKKLKNVEGFFRGKSDPFFEVLRMIKGPGGTTWRAVHRSEHVDNNLNPTWEKVTLPLEILCGCELDRPIRIAVYDHENSGRHIPMGFFETTVNALMKAAGDDKGGGFKLMKKGKEYGSVLVNSAQILEGHNVTPPMVDAAPVSVSATAAASSSLPMPIPPPSSQQQQQQHQQPFVPTSASAIPFSTPIQPPFQPPPPTSTSSLNNNNTNIPRPTFVDYISGACDLQMCVAIDFTGSNGDPRIPGTLHYVHPDGISLNDYEKAITAVCDIVAEFDADQKFPVWGFGAKYDGVVQHCFQVGMSAEADGVGGILEAYRSVFRTPLTMSGPTVFTQVIKLAAAQATKAQQRAQTTLNQQAYTILLILTDGCVSDVNATKQAILSASGAPLSIIIIGIGRTDFGAMRFLDDFDTRRGRERDICQFVEFDRFNTGENNKMALSRATLEEVPDQLVDYFYSRGILPLPGPSGSKMNVVEEDYDVDLDVDLNLNMGDDDEEEITLNSTTGGYVNGGYGTAVQYGGLTVLPPPGQGGGAMHASMPGHQQHHQQPMQPYQPGRASVASNRIFQVQVPAGVSPGMQMQVQNPTTGQMMVVTVPPNVPVGGLFPVSY